MDNHANKLKKAKEAHKVASKGFMALLVEIAKKHEVYFQCLTAFTEWKKLTIKDLEGDENNSFHYAYDLIEAYEEKANILEAAGQVLPIHDRRIVDRLVIDAYPLRIQFLETDLLEDKYHVEICLKMKEATQNVLKIKSVPNLKKGLVELDDKLQKFHELVLASELRLSRFKLKAAQYAKSKRK